MARSRFENSPRSRARPPRPASRYDSSPRERDDQKGQPGNPSPTNQLRRSEWNLTMVAEISRGSTRGTSSASGRAARNPESSGQVARSGLTSTGWDEAGGWKRKPEEPVPRNRNGERGPPQLTVSRLYNKSQKRQPPNGLGHLNELKTSQLTTSRFHSNGRRVAGVEN